MSKLVDRQVLERVTTLDLKLTQLFARQESDRLAHQYAMANAHVGVHGTSGAGHFDTDPPQSVVLGGLEVFYTSGSSVRVTQGQAICSNASPTALTRPGTWSGNIDKDDDTYSVYEFGQNGEDNANSYVPSVPIGGALGSAEWWVVYATPADVNEES